jgi:hypothetical protein
MERARILRVCPGRRFNVRIRSKPSERRTLANGWTIVAGNHGGRLAIVATYARSKAARTRIGWN